MVAIWLTLVVNRQEIVSMKPFQPLLSSLSVLLLLSSSLQAQAPQSGGSPKPSPGSAGYALNDPAAPLAWTGPEAMHRVLGPYQRKNYKAINMGDSSRLESLMRAGKIYLSVQDAVALALENNLDIEVARYGPSIADADILRAQAGGLLRGVQTGVTSGPTSASSQVTGGATGGAGGGASGTGAGGGTNAAASTGTVISQTGSTIPNFDPVFTSSLNWLHNSSPQSNTVTTGTNNLYYNSKNYNFGFQEGFATGTTANYNFNYQTFNNNNQLSQLNPSRQGSMTLTVSQHLLQGFGIAVNSRNIRVAKLNRKISDLVFEQQIITTVSSILNLYWDLVSFNEDLRVKRKALELSQKLYEDNKKQVEIGTLAKIEVTRAEAEVASREQDLTVSETALLQQEAIIKNALTKNGMASAAVYSARIVPTDRLKFPMDEKVPPLQDLMDVALLHRPELAQARLSVETSRINLAGTRSELLPTLDVNAAFTNNALAGDPNYLRAGQANFVPPSAYFVGGIGDVLGQILRRNFPTYSVGFSLNVPIRNRSAQADMARDSLTLRQQELRERQQQNQVRLDVQNAQIAVLQSRSRYLAAQKTRILQEQSLDAEQKKYALGASTIFLVIQAQRDLATAEGNEVTSMANYMRSKTQLNLATGQTLSANRISMDEARMGSVKRTADVPNPQN